MKIKEMTCFNPITGVCVIVVQRIYLYDNCS